jgi:hypothetical protein
MYNYTILLVAFLSIIVFLGVLKMVRSVIRSKVELIIE